MPLSQQKAERLECLLQLQLLSPLSHPRNLELLDLLQQEAEGRRQEREQYEREGKDEN